jgi:hypothetical protein
MKVFRLRPNYSYLSFYAWNQDEGGRIDMYASGMTAIGGTRRIASWNPLSLRPYKPGLPRGNFMYLWSLNFLVDEYALNLLRPLLRSCCEFLPLAPYEGQVFFLLNVLDCIDCLDKENTTWTSSKMIDEYSFNAHELPPGTLFKIPEDRGALELTASGVATGGTEFKSIVEHEGLTGLEFEEVWSEEGPRVGRNQRLRQALGF